MKMIYKFIDDQGTFCFKNPHQYNLYFPLIDASGKLLSSIGPNLSGDIKKDNEHFLTLPASIEDLRSSPLCRREFFIRIGRKVIRLSSPYQDTLEAGFLYHKLSKKVMGLDIEILNFIPNDLPVEVMRVKVRNISLKEIKITPTSFIPLYGRSEKNLRDHRHVSSLLNRVSLDKFGIFLKPSMIFDEKSHKPEGNGLASKCQSHKPEGNGLASKCQSHKPEGNGLASTIQGHRLNQTIYFVFGYEANRLSPVGQFPTLDYFFGRGDVFRPDAIFKDVPSVSGKNEEFDGKEVCAAFRFSEKKLIPGEGVEYILLLGIEEKENLIKEYFAKLNSPGKIERALERTKKYWQGYLSNLEFDFKGRDKNSWLLWVKFQPTLRKLFGCSFLPHFDYGKGGRGWRDLWQDALMLLLTQPEKSRKIITESFAGVRLDGSNATIIAKDNSFLADRNRINRVWMDHGVWPYLTTRFYIDRTGDLKLLLEKQAYFRDQQLNRAKAIDSKFAQKDFFQRAKNGDLYKGSILEHLLVQHLTQFFNVGEHNIIRLENADWNDGLDLAPDKGESVTFSFMYAHNLKSLRAFLEILKTQIQSVSLFKELTLLLDTLNNPVDYLDFKAKQKLLAKYFEKIKNISGVKIEVSLQDLIFDLEAKYGHLFSWLAEKEWLKVGFFNGYYDNKSLRVEGKFGDKTRMFLPTQVFAIMSAVALPEQIQQIWEAAKKYLKDEKLGGYHLNTDLGKPDLDLGRAFGFSYGDKENGAFFSHMNVMFANALYKRGFIDQGKQVWDSIFRMAAAPEAKIPPGLPEYFNSQGRGLYLYLTGSASWYIYTLFEEILGIKFCLGDILLEPKLMPKDFISNTIDTRFWLKTKIINITYERKNNFNSDPEGNQPYQIDSVYLGKKKIPFDSKRCFLKSSWFSAEKNYILVKLI